MNITVRGRFLAGVSGTASTFLLHTGAAVQKKCTQGALIIEFFPGRDININEIKPKKGRTLIKRRMQSLIGRRVEWKFPLAKTDSENRAKNK